MMIPGVTGCLPIIFLAAFSAQATGVAIADAVPTPQDILIVSSSNQNEQLTTSEAGVKHYAKKYILDIYNATDKNLSFSTHHGCFKAEDEAGAVSITQKMVDPTILKNLPAKSDGHGYVIFSSKDNSVLKTKFVTWSSDCSYKNSQ